MIKKLGLVIIVALVVVAIGISLYFTTQHDEQTAAPAPNKSYIALGDSVAAGIGLGGYSDSSACDRTDSSYPNLLARKLQYSLHNLSCSGATTTHGLLGSQTVNRLKLDSQQAQLFGMSRPDLVSLTIGANDADWTDIVKACYQRECGREADTAAVQTRLVELSSHLKTFFDNYQKHYAKNTPQLIVTGYYQVVPEKVTKTCSDLTGIDTAERTWARQQQQTISMTIEKTVKDYSLATYVPLDFSGHELCTGDSWVQNLSSMAPFHPTESGQTAIATQIEERIGNAK